MHQVVYYQENARLKGLFISNLETGAPQLERFRTVRYDYLAVFNSLILWNEHV